MRPPRRLLFGIVLCPVLALILSGCGIAVDTGPKALPASQVPFHLLAPAGSTTSTAPTGAQVVVYFLNGKSLIPRTRFVQAPVRLRSIIETLVQGPTNSELSSGVSTDISPQVQVLSATVNSGVATINFSQAIAGGTQQIPAVAQVVYTATEPQPQLDVHSVRLEIDGQPTNVPTASNAQVSGPVTRAQYPNPLP